MDSKAFIKALDTIVKEKNISADIVFEAMTLALQTAYKKNFDSKTNVRVDINRETGDIKVFSYFVVVDEIYTEKKGKYSFLTVVLDKVGGIDLDAIVMATNIINPIVDKYDICDDSYILDVISKERG